MGKVHHDDMEVPDILGLLFDFLPPLTDEQRIRFNVQITKITLIAHKNERSRLAGILRVGIAEHGWAWTMEQVAKAIECGFEPPLDEEEA